MHSPFFSGLGRDDLSLSMIHTDVTPHPISRPPYNLPSLRLQATPEGSLISRPLWHTFPQTRPVQESLALEPSVDSDKEMSPSPGVRALDTVEEHQILQGAEAPGGKRME